MALKSVANLSPKHTPSAEDIWAVAGAVEDMYHQMVAVHNLMSSIEFPHDCDFGENLVATKAIARSCAQRLDACVTKLTGSATGYYESEFGPV